MKRPWGTMGSHEGFMREAMGRHGGSMGVHGAAMGDHGGLMVVASLLNNGTTIKSPWGPRAPRATYAGEILDPPKAQKLKEILKRLSKSES